jgi:hypothetical protein
MFTIVIGQDEAGEFPLLLEEKDAHERRPTQWRRVAETDDVQVAAGVMELVIRRCLLEPRDAD